MKSNLINWKSYFIILFLSILINCKNENQTNSNHDWTQIRIKLDGQEIVITNKKNYSSFSRILIPKDTTEEFILTEVQKDSIYKIASQIIDNPITPDNLVAAPFAENFSLEISDDKTISQSTSKTIIKRVDFQYMKSWRTISEKTKELSSLLSRKIKLIK